MLHSHRDDRLLTLNLDHGKANALDLELVTALDAALAEAQDDEAVAAVILTGRGRIFCAGVDLRRLVDEGPDYAAHYLPALDRLLRRALLYPKPLVTAAQGHAVAGGALLAMASDAALLADVPDRPLRFGLPKLRVPGLFPKVAREIVHSATTPEAREILAEGRYLDPAEALELGLVDATPAARELPAVARRWALELSETAPEAFRSVKHERLARRARALETNAEAEARRVLEVWSAPETRRTLREHVEALDSR